MARFSRLILTNSSIMAQSTEESLLDKLLKSRYPLTYYLSRQQQFVKVYSTTQSVPVPTPPPPEPATIVANKRKAPLPPSSPCFNVPDTLDFNASGYERNDEMDQSSEMEDDGTREYNETLLLKSINNRINDSDIINEKNVSIIKRSSAIQLEFSPYENSSPLQKAIQNGLNIINK